MIALYGIVRLSIEYSRISAEFRTFRFYQKTSTLRMQPWVAIWSNVVLGLCVIEGTVFFIFTVYMYISQALRPDFQEFDSTATTKLGLSFFVR